MYVDVCNAITENNTGLFADLYPNPGSGLFTLHIISNEAAGAQVKIYNLQGQLIYSEIFNSTNNIDLTELSDGIYFMEVFTGKEVRLLKFIKQE
jgi:hypothetical protein